MSSAILFKRVLWDVAHTIPDQPFTTGLWSVWPLANEWSRGPRRLYLASPLEVLEGVLGVR